MPETSLDERLKILEHNGKIFQWWKYLQVLRTDRVYERNKYPIDVTAFHANSVDIDKMKTYLHPSDVGINFITEDNDVPVGMLWIDMDRVFYDFSLTDIDYDAFMHEEERWRLEF